MPLLFPEPKEEVSKSGKKKKQKGGGFQTVSALYRVSIILIKTKIKYKSYN